MTLVDTSVWVEHFRRGHSTLARLLENGLAGTHPFVVGELACGNLKNRKSTLASLGDLPLAPVAREREVHHLLESRTFRGAGLGWVDLHLLTAAAIAGWDVLTSDRAMRGAAARMGIVWREM